MGWVMPHYYNSEISYYPLVRLGLVSKYKLHGSGPLHTDEQGLGDQLEPI